MRRLAFGLIRGARFLRGERFATFLAFFAGAFRFGATLRLAFFAGALRGFFAGAFFGLAFARAFSLAFLVRPRSFTAFFFALAIAVHHVAGHTARAVNAYLNCYRDNHWCVGCYVINHGYESGNLV